MNKIIQLQEYEYNRLCDLAHLNEELINTKAEELYKQKGTCAISLIIKSNLVEDDGDKLLLTADSYVHECDDNYTLSDEAHERLEAIVSQKAVDIMRRRYGVQIDDYNSLQRKMKRVSTLYRVLTISTIVISLLLIILAILATIKYI